MGNGEENSFTILVVDDDPDVIFVIKRFLRTERYIVKAASSSEECFGLLKDENPDLILLDIMMPGIDGWEVCRRIKKDLSTSHIPVIIVSAMSEDEDARISLKAGAVEHLAKPIERTELLSTIEMALK